MGKPALPEGMRRVTISLSLSPAVIEILDGYVATGHAESRSRAAQEAILEWFEMTRTTASDGPHVSRRRR